MIYYTYYSYEEWGKGYIGAKPSGCEGDPMCDGYFGTFSDPNFFPTEKVILGVYETPEECLAAEVILHEYFEVDTNPHFANRARQTSSKFIRMGPQSTEERQKKSESLKGKPKTKEHVQKVSEALKGRQLSEEHKRSLSLNHADVSGDKNPMYGRTFSHTDEAKEKISAASRGRVKSEQEIEKIKETKRNNPDTNKFFSQTKWFTNGKENVRRKECPDGFRPGRTSK